MKKQDLKDELSRLDPSNDILNTRVSAEELKSELAAVKRRMAIEQKARAVPTTVKYRIELNESMSWKLLVDGESVTVLNFGDELPMEGSIVPSNDGSPLLIVRQEDGLTIEAIDLEVRETFDPRRIYTTPNGSHVAFKRVEDGRVVLWSYKVNGEIMVGSKVEVKRTERTARPTAVVPRRASQKILAAWIIAQRPNITGTQLTEELRNAFPHAQVSPRHGPHYLSLSRNGRLPEAPDTDPRTWDDKPLQSMETMQDDDASNRADDDIE